VASGGADTPRITVLDSPGGRYRLIGHAPGGQTDIVSPGRGNARSQAATCTVLMVEIGQKITTRRAWIAQWAETGAVTGRQPSRTAHGSR
jgi:hypothetical protein